MDKEASEVIILFSFDNYKTNYHMLKGEKGNFSLQLNLTTLKPHLKSGKYYYKMIVDGIYAIDPANKNTEFDPYLGQLSVFHVDDFVNESNDGPVRIDQNIVRFYFMSSSFQDEYKKIMLVGQFNHWKPYEFYLQQSLDDTRVWYVDVSLQKQSLPIEYLFVVDGKWTKDPHNSKTGINNIGQAVSLFYEN